MIAAGEPQEFTPYGRNHLAHHPGDVYLPVEVNTGGSPAIDIGKDLLKALRGVSIQDHYPEKESWYLREGFDGEEDEIYTSGKSVVWTTSNGQGTEKLSKTFTIENVVEQVVWCNFFADSWKPQASVEQQKNEGRSMHSICILDSSNLNVFATSGQDFTLTLPFQVHKMWVSKFGLLFERSSCDTESNNLYRDQLEKSPMIFSMLHPLDETVPVVKRTGGPSVFGKYTYWNDILEEIVYSNKEPSLVITYHKLEGVHSVWKIRKTTFEETCLSCLKIEDVGLSINNTPNTYASTQIGNVNQSVFATSGHSPAYVHSNNSSTPLRSFPRSRSSSPSVICKTQSPSSSLTHMATLSRSQSPLTTSNVTHRFSYTPPPVQSWIPSAPHSPKSNGLDFDFIDPLAPDICFDHEWTEPQSQSSGEKASKAFLTTDVIGQNFLCYHLKEKKQLRFIKFEESNDKTHLIFGASHYVSARDAGALPSLNLVLVLDFNYSLTLYTGTVKICKVHIPNTGGPFAALPGLGSYHSSLLGTPRRSSLITTSRSASAIDVRFEEEMKHLSPVSVHADDSSQIENILNDESALPAVGTITGLRDAVMNRITLETASGNFFRISLPVLTSSAIVDKCLQTLRTILPRDVSIQVYVKWYALHNAPGPSDSTNQSELQSFLLCLLGIMGYDTEQISLGGFLEQDLSLSPVAVKKLKTSEQGCDEDWNYILSTSHHHSSWNNQAQCLGLTDRGTFHHSSIDHLESGNHINTSATLFPYIANVLFALHLVYEDCKLNMMQWSSLPQLSSMLFELASDLQMNLYQDYYWREFPQLTITDSSRIKASEGEIKNVLFPPYFTATPPSVFSWFHACLLHQDISPFPYIPFVTKTTRDLILCYAHLTIKDGEVSLPEKYLKRITAPGQRIVEDTNSNLGINIDLQNESSPREALLLFITKIGMTLEDIDNLPVGITLPIREAILYCRNNPPSDWPEDAYALIGRQDLAALHSKEKSVLPLAASRAKSASDIGKCMPSKDDDDSLDQLDQEVLKLRFSEDHRLHEVHRMLQSSKPVRIALQQRPEVGDHEFIEEQERHLYTLCIRTMALPVGRGMFTLRTCCPVVTEALPIPKLCLTGRAPPRNTTVDLSHIEVPANMNMWPLFHNGVAAGLRIIPNAFQIDSTWIVYNKPRSSSNDTPTEHAGFLMALGLNGHLCNLSTMSIHDYLCKGHELTAVGLLLGIAAAKRGSMDLAVTKAMSIHVEALLPPTSTELDVPAVVQVAAVLGIGLLYQGSGHHHMAEVLLGEIGRPPGPEMEHSIDRESYALAAGLALGLVTLGKGSEVSGLTDLPMADQLYHYMVGGHKRPLTGIHKEKHKSPSYQIREGDSVNVDVTSPGATLALGMMFFNTNNSALADWMTAPDTQYLLDMVRPDFLLLRTLSKGLILWEEVHPSKAWIESHVPKIVSNHAFQRGQLNNDVDYETMSQTYCNIIAGACMSVGLKFAGSANQDAFDILLHYTKMFLNLSGKPVADQAGKSTIETCLNVAVLSLAVVMAGTGDLEVLRICRHLRSRISLTSNYVLYGSHMANHMALGILFLGGGRFTLGTSPEAVGAMVCAFFPKFPTHSNDNRYHLQAFRHLYVLAVKPRLIIPRHIDTGKAVYTNLKIKFKDTNWYRNAEYTVRAPCLLPELHLLEEVIVDDYRYWPIIFDCTKNWHTLKGLLENNGTLFVKQKAGCLPYQEDPKGFRSLLAQSMMKDSVRSWKLKPTAVTTFSNDALAVNFANFFLKPRTKIEQEREWQQKMCDLLFECASQEKIEMLSTCLTLLEFSSLISHEVTTLGLWQLKLMLAHQKWLSSRNEQQSLPEELCVMRHDLILSIKNQVEKCILQMVQDHKDDLSSYLMRQNKGTPFSAVLAPFLVYHDIPPTSTMEITLTEGSLSLPSLYLQLRSLQIPVSSLLAVLSVLQPTRVLSP